MVVLLLFLILLSISPLARRVFGSLFWIIVIIIVVLAAGGFHGS